MLSGLSTLAIRPSLSPIPPYAKDPECSGTTCVFTARDNFIVPEYDTGTIIRLLDLGGRANNVQSEMVGTKYGITLSRSTGSSENNPHFRSFGAWMEHSGFSMMIERGIDGYDSYWGYYPVPGYAYGGSGGAMTGSRPLGSATWRGLMVGTPMYANYGDRPRVMPPSPTASIRKRWMRPLPTFGTLTALPPIPSLQSGSPAFQWMGKASSKPAL